jgi:hypothetical protein
VSTPYAVLAGTWNKPVLRLYFDPSEPHAAAPDKTLIEWVQSYLIEKCEGQGWWTGRERCWTINATGPDPARKLRLAGFTIDFTETAGTTLEQVVDINEVATPITRLSADGSSVFILPRLLGYEKTKKLLGSGARWDREHKRFAMPVSDAMHRGAPREGIEWEPNVLEAARYALGRVTTRAEIATATAAAGAAKDVMEMDQDDVAKLIELVGDVPDWFGLDLFPFQRIGSIAVAAGHFGLFDEPGLGKTRQTIASAAILGSQRTLITCLPVGVTGWSREVEESLLHKLGGNMPEGEIRVIRGGGKKHVGRYDLPEKGVVITSDSLLTARPDLLKEIIEWQPEFFGYDEAHRGKTFESKRSQAMMRVAKATIKAPVAITGTPLFANPAELAPILELTGHLGPVFGGLDAFLNRYCKMDHFGTWKARKEHLPELRLKLQQQVWVRRRKRDVLPDLPQTLRVPKWVDVPLTDYRRAHKDVITTLTKWVQEVRKANGGVDPDEETIRDFAVTQIGLISQLRKAAGVAKIPAIVDDIVAHVKDTETTKDGQKFYPRPLIVWTHHRDVSDAMLAAVPAVDAPTGAIRGGVSHQERDRLVSEFQAGRIAVLVCSIAAAGVAITLTASSDMIFAESDWTPAAIRQAMDRAERIGQTADKIIATTYLAPGTLDPRIQQVLKEKSKILDAIYGDGNDVSVIDSDEDVATATQIVVGLIDSIIAGEVEKP